MPTALSDGYIYLIESDAVDNQNWVPTPGNIDLDNFTGMEGIEYCKLEFPQQFTKSFSTGATVTSAAGANEFDARSARRAYSLLAEGIPTSITNAGLVEKFCMSDRHTSGASLTFKRYYLIIRFSSSSYVQFTDSSDTRRDYCKGIVLNGDVIWRESKGLNATVRLNWRSVW